MLALGFFSLWMAFSIACSTENQLTVVEVSVKLIGIGCVTAVGHMLVCCSFLSPNNTMLIIACFNMPPTFKSSSVELCAEKEEIPFP